MNKTRLAAFGLLAAVLTVGPGQISWAASEPPCSEAAIDTGNCNVEGLWTDANDGVDLVGEFDGGDVAPGTHHPVDDDSVGNGDEPSAPLPPAPPPPANCSPTNMAICAGVPATPPEAEPETPVVVTLRDIASFRPAVPRNEMQPGGWAVEGLPANFVAAASVEVVSGTLLGQPADVRFTPVGYRWSHSDGAVVETATPGATWAVLGQPEFSGTPTSHVYARSGEYTVELAVVLQAEYRFAGSPWRSVAGTLSVAGEPQRVLVGEFDTVLTQGDCNTNPSGPGC